MDSLATEAREKLEVKPLNIAQASRISGVNPDISILLVYLEQGKLQRVKN